MNEKTNDVLQFFNENQEGFTVYVVERRFAVERGHEFFKSYNGSEHYIKTESEIRLMLNKILKYVQRSIPNIADLIDATLISKNKLSILELLNALNKLFFTNEHQAAGIDVIDPIIIEEDAISPKYISQIISLHKHSILRPVIIIILKDNNFERAKNILNTCPHGLNVKFIRNSGETEIIKIINTGALDVEGFLDAFSRQCFSTCSQTKRNILINNEWSKNSIINSFAPSILKIRTNLLYDEKDEAIPIISNAQCLVDEYGARYMTIKMAKSLKSMGIKLNINLFNTAWELLDSKGKENLMLENLNLLDANMFENCFSELEEPYRGLSYRSKRHTVFLPDNQKNRKLAQRLYDIEYITSFQKKPVKTLKSIKSEIVCRVKVAS